MREFILKLLEREDLSEAEAERAMDIIMSGEATPAQIGAFMTALRMKGETIAEITGCARAMRRKATPVRAQQPLLVDTCGTGGDGAGTFNISTTVAFVVAGAGLPVAKHGNRSVSSSSGSADVLEALGVNINLGPEDIARCIDEVGIGFLFAPALHGAMRHAAGPRRELGVRTIFNLLGPLTNPAGAAAQVLGVFAAGLTEPMAAALGRLGSRRAFVVYGLDGLDEISISGPTRVSELGPGGVRTYQIEPEQFGIARAPREAIRGGRARENAAITLEVLRGERGPRRDVVLINAAAALVAGGMAADIEEGLARARESIDSGRAMEKLERLRRFTEVYRRCS